MKDFNKYFIVGTNSDALHDTMNGTVTGELIRCKDCKYYDGYYCHNKHWGDGYGNYTPPIKQEDGFCDWADKKESVFAYSHYKEIVVDNVPTIETEPVRHGKWMGTVCTACGESTFNYYDCDYCPKCGARME